MKDKKAVIYSIKIYRANLFVTPADIDRAVEYIIAAGDEVVVG